MSDDPLLRSILAVIAFSVFIVGVRLSMPWLHQQYNAWWMKRMKRKLRRELDRLQRVCITNYERMPATDIAQILTWKDQIDVWDPPVYPAQPKQEPQGEEHVWLYNLPGQRMSVRDMLEIPPVVPHFSGYDLDDEGSPWWIQQEQQRLLREIDEILEREQF